MSVLRYSGPSPFYEELAELPVPTSAQFINTAAPPEVSVARISYSIRDHTQNVKRSVTRTLTLGISGLTTTESPVISSTISPDSPEIVASLYAPSGKRHALLREVSDANGTKKRHVEVWSGTQLEASMEVTKRHGQFHTDDYLKSFSFTPSETAFVYTAEVNTKTDEERNDNPYTAFRFTPSFGEQLYTKKRPALWIFRWRRPEWSSVLSPPTLHEIFALKPHSPVLLGQATFATETRLYATGYEYTPDGRLLGIKACINRPTSIWQLNLPGEILGAADITTTIKCEATKCEIQGRSCRSPRILFNENRIPTALFWLSNPTGGAHASTASLHVRDLNGNGEEKVLVHPPHDPSAEDFPGLYIEYNLADNPFLRSGGKTYVVAQSLWRSRATLILIDVENGSLTDLTPDLQGQALSSWNLLGTDSARSVICSRSTPTSPPETNLLTLSGPTDGNFPTTEIRLIDRPSISPKLQGALDRIDASVVSIPDRYPAETILIRSKDPNEGDKPICVTVIHGGPHTASMMSFTPYVLAYALEGYTISLPNYTGSTGYGEKYVQELIGKCGTLDVADCVATVEHLIQLGLSEAGKQVVHGGSHGGFLVGHLIGQYPDLFRAAVLRNPVISVGELCASDIPDWAFREFGLAFEPGTHVTPERFATLHAASPIAHVDRVKAPALILLGEDDLRVPTTQGKGYYHALKGRGRAVELLVFPKETHPIDGVEAAKVAFEAGRDWIQAYTQ